MKPVLTINELIQFARQFCEIESRKNHIELIGVTDGKAVGTYVEHKFQNFLQSQCVVDIGSSAKGIDLPGDAIQTDIKVTSVTQPQSSCPFENARQKIFGLGYNLLVFVYDKHDTNDVCKLHFTHCTFINKERTAFVIVTQKKVREETGHLEWEVPKTWEYLNDNIELFENRKSSIYHGAPPFSMFGVGDYSYSKYKVGISGFYKRPLFSVLYSDNNKPVMTDDTSYFICFDSYDMAYVAMLLLNAERVQRFLTSIAFLDAKRPYTKKVLERIDFHKIVDTLTFDDLAKTEHDLNLSEYVTLPMYDDFKSLLDIGQMRFA